MLTDITKTLLEFLKLAPRYLISVALVCGTLLFSPNEWLQRIGVSSFTQAYRQWLGLTFLISSILWGVAIAVWGYRWVGRKVFRRNVKQQIIRRLNTLTEDEKQILRYYFANNTRANTLRMDDGVVQGLATDHIIYRSASMGNLIDGFAHNINDFAWEYIHKNPHVLDGTTDHYRTDKRYMW